MNFVVEDDEDDEGADDVEEQVHPEDIDLEQITIGSNDTITKSTLQEWQAALTQLVQHLTSGLNGHIHVWCL